MHTRPVSRPVPRVRATQPPGSGAWAISARSGSRRWWRTSNATRLPHCSAGISYAETARLTELSAKAGFQAPASADLARASAAQGNATLTQQRAACDLAVKSLVAKGLPGERLFLAAPRLRASGEDDATWTPRVQLTLATN